MSPVTLDERFWQRRFWLGRTDARIVALFRIVFAALIFLDFAERLPDLFRFYSDEGLLPRTALYDGLVRAWRFSLFDTVGAPPLVALLYGASGVAIVALALGYRTRAASVAVWLYLLSIQERNLVVIDSGDTVLRVLAFWLMFADAGAVWSLDVRWQRRERKAWIPVAPLRVMQLQVAIVYLCAAVYKTGPQWHAGTAIYHAMQLGDWVRPFGVRLLEYPWLCEVLTRATLFVEGGFIVLVLSPVLTGPVRLFAIASIVGLHAGIFLTMRVGMFSLVMPATMLLFVMPSWMARLAGPPPVDAAAETRGWRPSALALAPVALLAIVVWSQLVPFGGPIKRVLSPPVELIGMWQNWAMFAPDPLHEDGFWQGNGEVADGGHVDVLAAVMPYLKNERDFRFRRWVKYRSELGAGNHSGALRPLALYLCRAYNHERTDQLKKLELIYHHRPTRDPGEAPAAWQADSRWTIECGNDTVENAPLRPRRERPEHPIVLDLPKNDMAKAD